LSLKRIVERKGERDGGARPDFLLCPRSDEEVGKGKGGSKEKSNNGHHAGPVKEPYRKWEERGREGLIPLLIQKKF